MEQKENKKIIDRALKAAACAAQVQEVPVGAVIFNSQTYEIVSTAFNQTEKTKDVLAHAEMLAIRKASKKLKQKFLSGYSMFVTLEPCSMCAGAISWARLDALYYGAKDPKTGAVLQGAKIFTRSQTHHKPKLHFKPIALCGKMMHDFFVTKRQIKKYQKDV